MLDLTGWENKKSKDQVKIVGLNGLAYGHMAKREFKKALEALSKAERIDPENFFTANLSIFGLSRIRRCQKREKI